MQTFSFNFVGAVKQIRSIFFVSLSLPLHFLVYFNQRKSRTCYVWTRIVFDKVLHISVKAALIFTSFLRMLMSVRIAKTTYKRMHMHTVKIREKKNDENNIKIYAISTSMTRSLVLLLNIFAIEVKQLISYYGVLQTPTVLCNRRFEDCWLCVRVQRAIFIATTSEMHKRLQKKSMSREWREKKIWNVHEWLITITMMLAVMMAVDDTHKHCMCTAKVSYLKEFTCKCSFTQCTNNSKADEEKHKPYTG